MNNAMTDIDHDLWSFVESNKVTISHTLTLGSWKASADIGGESATYEAHSPYAAASGLAQLTNKANPNALAPEDMTAWEIIKKHKVDIIHNQRSNQWVTGKFTGKGKYATQTSDFLKYALLKTIKETHTIQENTH